MKEKESKYTVNELVSESYAELGVQIKHFWETLKPDVVVIESHLFFDKYTHKVYYLVVMKNESEDRVPILKIPSNAYQVTKKRHINLWTRIKSTFK